MGRHFGSTSESAGSLNGRLQRGSLDCSHACVHYAFLENHLLGTSLTVKPGIVNTFCCRRFINLMRVKTMQIHQPDACEQFCSSFFSCRMPNKMEGATRPSTPAQLRHAPSCFAPQLLMNHIGSMDHHRPAVHHFQFLSTQVAAFCISPSIFCLAPSAHCLLQVRAS